MKCDMTSFSAMQNVKRFITNGGSIPFLYRLDLSGLGTPLSDKHIVRIVEHDKGKVIICELSQDEANIVARSEDPIKDIIRWLQVLYERTDNSVCEGAEKEMPEKIKTCQIFNDDYFIIGHAYRLRFAEDFATVPEQFRGTTVDALCGGFDTHHHNIVFAWYADKNRTIRQFTFTIQDFMDDKFDASILS